MQSECSNAQSPHCINMTKEADEILSSKSLLISPTGKYKYEQSFLKYLELKRLLGNYMIPLGLITALIVGITVFLFLYLFDIQKYWMYILLITSGVLLTLLIAAFGFRWKRATKMLKRREMNSWIAKRFLQWSLLEIEKEANCNKKRFLIENLLNLHSRFVPTDPDSREASAANEIISRIINAPDNQSPGFLICIIFKKIFRGPAGTYLEAGRTAASKLLVPYLRFTSSEQLKAAILGILDDFYRDTNIDVRMSTLNAGFIDPEEEVKLEKEAIENPRCGLVMMDCEFFEDVWKVDEHVLEAFHKELGSEVPSESPELSHPSNILQHLEDQSGHKVAVGLPGNFPADDTPSELHLLAPSSQAEPQRTTVRIATVGPGEMTPVGKGPKFDPTDRILIPESARDYKNSQLGKMTECSFNRASLSKIYENKKFDMGSSGRTVESMKNLLEGREEEGGWGAQGGVFLGGKQ